MGPLDASVAWSTTGLDGSRRFLDRVWRLIINEDTGEVQDKIVNKDTPDVDKVYHETVKKISDDYETLDFNTAISQMMVFVNECNKQEEISKEYIENFVKMLSPIAPHIAEELWDRLGHGGTIAYEAWPIFDENKLIEEEIEIVIQVNGKVREKMNVPTDASKEDLERIAIETDKIQEVIKDKTVRKVIAVPGKLINIVAN